MSTTVATGLTDIGRVRAKNEDAYVVIPGDGIAVVADGMGGHPGGEVASQLAAAAAASVLAASVQSAPAEGEDYEPFLTRAMTESVASAHATVRRHAADDPELDGMGTTLTAIVVFADTGRYAIGHVGDTRVYLLRESGFEQLTRDDSWVQDQVDRGILTEEQASRHPLGHIITQCVGLEAPPVANVRMGTIRPGEVLLACSDGLPGMADDTELERSLREALADGINEAGLEAAARALVELANDAGGHDNITVALLGMAD